MAWKLSDERLNELRLMSIEELKKVDINFNSKNDVDELAQPLYELIMQCKNLIEQ